MAAWAGLAILIAGVSIPMLVGLREPDLASDEAIYSYAVERIVDTGEWLTPRAIPTDGPFLEKPPLALWAEAAGIKLGLLPRDEAGLRRLAALLGAVAFVYVYLIGQRLAGVTGGLVAAVTLFSMHPLAFDHGLRSNNMEAPVFLCYCGGLFHFVRWVESEGTSRARRHALAVAGFFVLGFMTKDVAALFLPLVGGLALAWLPRGDGWPLVRARLADWRLPIALALLTCAPWFLYESWRFGGAFWREIFGVHVYQRFTSSLDPSHLQPWHYYVSATWHELTHAGAEIVAVAGLARLAYVAWRDQVWLARVVLLWGVVPMVLISIGTSKLLHYAYPFWPPIGIGAGMAFTWMLGKLDEPLGAWCRRVFSRGWAARPVEWSRRPGSQYVPSLVIVAGLVALSVATLVHGPVLIERGGMQLLRNTSALRPMIFAVIMAGAAAFSGSLARLTGALLLALILPLGGYANEMELVGRIDHPLRTTRECVAEVQQSGASVAPGTLAASGDVFHHSYYFYLRNLGPWTRTEQFSAEQTLERLTAPGRQTPVLIARSDYDAIVPKLPAVPAGLRYDQNIAVILPGPFAPCAGRILEDGGWPLWDRPAR